MPVKGRLSGRWIGSGRKCRWQQHESSSDPKKPGISRVPHSLRVQQNINEPQNVLLLLLIKLPEHLQNQPFAMIQFLKLNALGLLGLHIVTRGHVSLPSTPPGARHQPRCQPKHPEGRGIVSVCRCATSLRKNFQKMDQGFEHKSCASATKSL